MFIERRSGELVYMVSTLIEARHAFSTRLGGVSDGDFASLNLGFGRGDGRGNVLENYRRLGDALGIAVDASAYTKQVHGNVVRIVRAGEGVSPTAPAPCEADGLVTAAPGLPLFCFTADCVPVLLHEPEAGVAAAVHCGWRGSVSDILGVAVGEMTRLGARLSAIRAAIGPAIGTCCFETDGDVPVAVTRWLDGDTAGLILRGARDGKYMVDLRGANRRRLLQLGLRPEHIDVSDECTKCSPQKYWSHRGARGGGRGSQCAVITL